MGIRVPSLQVCRGGPPCTTVGNVGSVSVGFTMPTGRGVRIMLLTFVFHRFPKVLISLLPFGSR